MRKNEIPQNFTLSRFCLYRTHVILSILTLQYYVEKLHGQLLFSKQSLLHSSLREYILLFLNQRCLHRFLIWYFIRSLVCLHPTKGVWPACPGRLRGRHRVTGGRTLTALPYRAPRGTIGVCTSRDQSLSRLSSNKWLDSLALSRPTRYKRCLYFAWPTIGCYSIRYFFPSRMKSPFCGAPFNWRPCRSYVALALSPESLSKETSILSIPV